MEAMPLILNNLFSISTYNKSPLIDTNYSLNSNKHFPDPAIREHEINGSDNISEDLQTKLLIEDMVIFGEKNNVMDTLKPVTENSTFLQTDQLIVQR